MRTIYCYHFYYNFLRESFCSITKINCKKSREKYFFSGKTYSSKLSDIFYKEKKVKFVLDRFCKKKNLELFLNYFFHKKKLDLSMVGLFRLEIQS